MSTSRVLMVQCCHPAQFLYVTEKLRQRYPRWEFQALVTDHSQVSHYLDVFPHFQKVSVLGRDDGSDADRIVFPLLNRGYWKIKRAAAGGSANSWEVDYEGHLHSLSAWRLYLSTLYAPAVPPDFGRYLLELPHPPLGKEILFLESCHTSLVAKTRRRWKGVIPDSARVTRIQPGPARTLWKQARLQSFDSALVFFSGEKGFLFMKLLPFLLRLPQILVVNETGHFFRARMRSLTRFLAGRVLHGVSSPVSRPKILFMQTETPRYLARALEKLKEKDLHPHSEIVVLCREKDREVFEGNPHVNRVLTYQGGRLKTNLGLAKHIRQVDADVACAVFSGRPFFRKLKLFYFFLPIRRHLVFNAQLDCYYLTPRKFLWIFRKEPPLFDSAEASHQRVLLLQTEDPTSTLSALDTLLDPRVVPNASVSVFCSETNRHLFECLEGVQEVFTYHPGRLWRSLRTLFRMVRTRTDVAAAVFSGRPVFRKQKALFFLLPARSRLVFNEKLDCFYLNWRNFSWLFTKSNQAPVALLLKALRLLCFLPRFLYLVIWATVMKLKRALAQD